MSSRSCLEYYGSFRKCCCCSLVLGLTIAALLDIALGIFMPYERWFLFPKRWMLVTEIKEENIILLNTITSIVIARKATWLTGSIFGILGIFFSAPKMMLIFWISVLADMPLSLTFTILYFIAFPWSLLFSILLWLRCNLSILFALWISALVFSYCRILRQKQLEPLKSKEQQYLIANEVV